MAYGDPLDQSTPADLDMAGQGDDRIRELKRALRQRLASFFVDVDADPLVPKAGSINPAVAFADGSIPGTKITINSLPADRIIGGGGGGGGGVTDNSVYTNAIQNLAVSNGKLADNSVDARVIAPGAVGSSELAVDAVNNVAIIDGALSRSKILPALKANLTFIATHIFQFPPATILAPGDTYWDITTIITNDQTGGSVMVHMQPDLDYADSGLPAHWSDGLTMHGNIGVSGVTEKLILRIHNASAVNRDVSSHYLWCFLFQRLSTAVVD
jgi:hypothetical protein